MKHLAWIALLLCSPSLFAEDGAIEINQICVAVGCFQGDSPGFPVQIGAPGSYRLTSNLDVTGLANPENASAILIFSGNVHLDLNGFSVIGPTSCSGGIPTCAPSGTGIGIGGISFQPNIRIENGAVFGFGNHGIDINAAPMTIRQMQIGSNAGSGIVAPSGGQFIENDVSQNGGIGIDTSSAGVTRSSRLVNNGGDGVDAGICDNNYFVLNGTPNQQSCTAQISNNICGSVPCP